jgi:hypothetical protein
LRNVRRSRGFDFSSLARKWPALTVALLVSLLLGWLIVRSATVSAFWRSRPAVAARIAPGNPQVAEGLVELDLRLRMGVAGPRAKQAAQAALDGAPLMEEPFLLAGIDRLLKRDYRAAERLLGEALERNPRSRLARLFMLEVELRSRRVASAAANMTILSRLMPDVQRVFVPELARFAREPETRDTMAQVLRSDPEMLSRVLQHLASRGARPEVVLDLAGNTRFPPEPEEGDWRRTLLDSMVKRGDFPPAHRLWARFAGIDPAKLEPGVYDGGFDGLPGSPPFNWTFASSEMGVAEKTKNGGLEVVYYGRTPGDLASQLLMLSPGRYRLSFYAEGDLSGPQTRLLWRVRCARGDTQLLELPLANITYAGRTLAGDFTVPPRCPAQWLRLVGEPTEFPKIENVLIRNLRVQGGGPAR